MIEYILARYKGRKPNRILLPLITRYSGISCTSKKYEHNEIIRFKSQEEAVDYMHRENLIMLVMTYRQFRIKNYLDLI